MSRLYLKQALSLGESVALHGPKVDVRFSTGDDQVGVHGMKHSSQYRVIGALQRQEASRAHSFSVCNIAILLFTVKGSGYLDISQLLLLLPVPNRQDVIVGIVHSAEECAAVLTGKQKS